MTRSHAALDRRQFLAAAGAGVWVAAASRRAQSATARRNVVLYVTDDHSALAAGCYGNPFVKTPGLDALAQEGVRMSHAFCTSSSCSPSRSVILSGRFSHATGQYGLHHSYHHFESFADIETLPVLLARAGYRTVTAGKFHVGPAETYRFGERLPGGPPREMAEACRSVFEARDERPFFLTFCTTEAHRPFNHEGSVPVDPAQIRVPGFLPDTAACREELAEYYGAVQRADSGLLRLMDIMKETGCWDDTLLLCISDNGMPFPGAKTTLYDPGTHLPCVLRNPFAARKGHACNAQICWADIAPTIMDFAGVPHAPNAFHGRSFLAAAEQEAPEGWDDVYGSHTFHEVTMYYPMRSVRTRQYKLIWNIAHGLAYPFASDLWESRTWQDILSTNATHYGARTVDAYLNRPRFELYDHTTDPNEARNLADDPEHTAVLTELKAKLRAFQERTKDPWSLKWDRE